ncbi:MAG: hypothetical protein M1834_007396 [Cirrosporium novae-zelandiae]|nr:MAG: hypothetical protein M1834_007396 [Cirrosporium novae-zelandiae]
MKSSKLAVDGLWSCLCPSFDSKLLWTSPGAITSRSRPSNSPRHSRLLPDKRLFSSNSNRRCKESVQNQHVSIPQYLGPAHTFELQSSDPSRGFQPPSNWSHWKPPAGNEGSTGAKEQKKTLGLDSNEWPKWTPPENGHPNVTSPIFHINNTLLENDGPNVNNLRHKKAIKSNRRTRPRSKKSLDVLIDRAQHLPFPKLWATIQELLEEYPEDLTCSTYIAAIISNIDPQFGSAEQVGLILQEMVDREIQPNSRVLHAVLKVLAVHPDYVLRQRILQNMSQRWMQLTPVGWHDLIVGYIRDKQVEMALRRLDEMEHQKIPVQRWLYDLIIYTLCDLDEFGEAMKILQREESVGGNDISPNLWYTLLDASSQALHYHTALYVWNKRVLPGYLNPSSGICENVLVTASRYGDPTLATDAFRILGTRKTKFTASHYESLLEAYTNTSDLHNAFSVLCIMQNAGIHPFANSTCPLFKHLREYPSRLLPAIQVLRSLRKEKRDIPTVAINVVLESCIHHSNLSLAIELYKIMHTMCTSGPDTKTFNWLLAGCVADGRKDLAMFLLAEMQSLNIKPDHRTMGHIVEVCLTQESYDDVFRYLEEMREQGRKLRRSSWVKVMKRCLQEKDTRALGLLRETRPTPWKQLRDKEDLLEEMEEMERMKLLDARSRGA